MYNIVSCLIFSIMISLLFPSISLELGENACRLLKKMHESVALQALEKFSSCDGSMMRSKEGYLIGILRKASERS